MSERARPVAPWVDGLLALVLGGVLALPVDIAVRELHRDGCTGEVYLGRLVRRLPVGSALDPDVVVAGSLWLACSLALLVLARSMRLRRAETSG